MGLHFGPKLLKHVTLKDYKWPNMLTTINPFYDVILYNTTLKPII